MNPASKRHSQFLVKIVFELRYRQGHTYLDRCGRTINLIQEYFPDWVLAPNFPSPQGSALINTESGCKFGFSSFKMDIGLDRTSDPGYLKRESLDEFAKEVGEIVPVVIDQLALVDFSRMGCRTWHMFEANSAEEAWLILNSFRFFDVSNVLFTAFNGRLESASLAAIINGVDRKYRIALDSIERTAEIDLGDAVLNVPAHLLPSTKRGQESERRTAIIAKSRRKKHPPFAAFLDVDAFREEPASVESPAEFVLSSILSTEQGIRAAMAESKD